MAMDAVLRACSSGRSAGNPGRSAGACESGRMQLVRDDLQDQASYDIQPYAGGADAGSDLPCEGIRSDPHDYVRRTGTEDLYTDVLYLQGVVQRFQCRQGGESIGYHGIGDAYSDQSDIPHDQETP